MKKWEESQRLKQYAKKIGNAKSTLSKKSPKSNVVDKSIRTPVRSLKSAASNRSNQIGDYYEHEKEDKNNIPLYRLLRLYNLQQYAKELISRGYGYNLQKFNYMSMQQLNTLFEEIKVLPGHKTKLFNLIDYIGELIPDISQNFSGVSQQSSQQDYDHYLNQGYSRTTAVPKQTRSNSQKVQLGNSFSKSVKNSGTAGRPVSANTYSGGPIRPNQKLKNNQNMQRSANKDNEDMYKTFKKQNQNLEDSYQYSDYTQLQQQQQQQENYYDEDDGLEIYQQKLENEFNSYYSQERQQQNQSYQQQQSQQKQYEEEEEEDQYQNYDNDFEQYNDQNNNIEEDSNAYLDEETSQALKEIGIDYFSDKEKNDEFCNTLHNIMKKYQTGDTQQQFYGKNLQQQNNKQHSIHSKSNSNNNNNTYNFVDSQNFSQNQDLQEDQFEQSQSQYYQEHEEVEIDEDYQYNKVQDSGLIVSYTQNQNQNDNTNKQNKKDEDNLQKQQVKQLQQKQQQKQQQQQQQKKNSNFIEQNKQNIKKQQEQKQNKENQNQQQQQNLNQTIKKPLNNTQQSQQSQQNQLINNKQAKKDPQKQELNKQLQSQKKAQDDIILVPEINESNEIKTIVKQSKIITNIQKHVVDDGSKELDIKNVNLELEKIKNLYISYDSGKLTSTIVNLDLEEMCFCLASAIEKHLEHFTKKMPQITKQVMTQSQLQDIQELDEDNYQQQKNQKTQLVQKSQIQQQKSLKLQQSQKQSQLLKQSQQQKKSQNFTKRSQQSYLSDNMNLMDEPSQVVDKNRPEPEIDMKNYYKSQFLKDQSQIQDILKQSLLIQQSQQQQKQGVQQQNPNRKNSSNYLQYSSDLQYSQQQDMLLSNPQHFYDMEEVQSDNEDNVIQDNKSQNKMNNNKSNISKNQSLANRLSHRDGQEEDLNISHDEDDITESELQRQYDKLEEEENELKKQQEVIQQELQDNQIQQQQLEQSQQQQQQNQSDFMYDSKLDRSLDDISYQQCDQSYQDSTNIQQSQSQQSQSFRDKQSDKQSILSMQKSTLSLQESSLNFSMISTYTSVVKGKSPQAMFIQNKTLFDKTFNEQAEDEILNKIPNKQLIQNYCKNIVITSKMEKEVIVISLVYIERLLLSSLQGLTSLNWRRILMISLIMGSKIWDDQSFENENFAQAFDTYTTRQINEFERVFLDFIDYRLTVKSSEYAKYYFILRTFAEKNKKSFPLRPLDLPTILRLQNGGNKVEVKLREQYLDPLNKSF